VSVVWIALLGFAVAILVLAEWPRLDRWVGFDARRGREHVQRVHGVRLFAPLSGDRQALLAQSAHLPGVAPPKGQTGHPCGRPHDHVNVISLLRDRQAFLERPPRRVLVEFPKREDARTV